MFLIILIFGLMVVGNPSLILILRLLVLEPLFTLLLSFFDSCHWGHAHDLDAPHEGSSHIFSGIPGPIQSVQRAEYWGVILALQAYSGIHIGIDNLSVLRGVAALLDHGFPRTPPSAQEGW